MSSEAGAAGAANVADVVIVGSASRDIAHDDPRGWRLGGAVSYGALTLARLGLRVLAIIGGDREVAESRELEQLREAGVDLRPIALERSPVFENIERDHGRVQTAIEPGDRIPAAALPSDAQGVGTWLLAPVADELPEAWADAGPRDALVGLGWQGLLRDLLHGREVRRRAPRPSRLVERAAIVGISRDDLAVGTEVTSLLALLSPGSTLVVTDGPRGGERLIAARRGVSSARYAAVADVAEVDATGAGDVFLATYLAARRGRPPADSDAGDLALAAAAASLAVERPGIDGVPTLTELARRLERTVSHAPG